MALVLELDGGPVQILRRRMAVVFALDWILNRNFVPFLLVQVNRIFITALLCEAHFILRREFYLLEAMMKNLQPGACLTPTIISFV